MGVAQIEKIGYFAVAGKAAAGGGYHHYAAGTVGQHYVLNLCELFSTCKGGAAKLTYLKHYI